MEEGEAIGIDNGDGTDIELLIEQEPLMSIYQGSPSALFGELQFQKADVYSNELVPSAPTAAANSMYQAYHLVSPLAVLLNKETGTCSYEFRVGEENRLTRRLAFARRSTATEESILQARKERDRKKAEKLAATLGSIGATEDTTEDSAEGNQGSKQKRGRGRPPGSKNKKTLEREAELARLQEEGKSQPKRGRGRPPGSKNKKTLEREAAERARQEAEAKASRKRGRPKGSKNKKTLEREAAEQARQEAGENDS